ncbi:hypothetical protein H5410_055841 [Solanum commersonii]|uniref:Uncharacterized protein n=1 Tax=Solanum commersonii TaxID=4109 RepID=A0A9J5WIN2_SOLCO|nr:hypothetical protein H5410_055841 [Solanum commersonii]
MAVYKAVTNGLVDPYTCISFISWPLIHRGGRKWTNAHRRPLNRRGVRERSGVGGARHHNFAIECEREATLASGEENEVEMKTGEGESICDFVGKNGDDSGDGFLRSILVVKQ